MGAKQLNDDSFFFFFNFWGLFICWSMSVSTPLAKKKKSHLWKCLYCMSRLFFSCACKMCLQLWNGMHCVHCITRTIHAVMNRAGWGASVPAVCKTCQQDWHFDDGYLKRHSRLWERRIICLVLLQTLGDTAQGSHPPPTVHEQKPMSEVSLR